VDPAADALGTTDCDSDFVLPVLAEWVVEDLVLLLDKSPEFTSPLLVIGIKHRQTAGAPPTTSHEHLPFCVNGQAVFTQDISSICSTQRLGGEVSDAVSPPVAIPIGLLLPEGPEEHKHSVSIGSHTQGKGAPLVPEQVSVSQDSGLVPVHDPLPAPVVLPLADDCPVVNGVQPQDEAMGFQKQGSCVEEQMCRLHSNALE